MNIDIYGKQMGQLRRERRRRSEARPKTSNRKNRKYRDARAYIRQGGKVSSKGTFI